MRADARFVLFPQFLERKFNDMSEEIEIKDEVLDLKVTDKYDENQIQVLEGLELSASARVCTSVLPRTRSAPSGV